jgi:hypothetical protein
MKLKKVPNSISHLKHLRDNCPDVVSHTYIRQYEEGDKIPLLEREISFNKAILGSIILIIILFLLKFSIC